MYLYCLFSSIKGVISFSLDLHALKTTVNITEENQGERVFKAQSAIKGKIIRKI